MRWTLRRGKDSLTCEIDTRTSRTFALEVRFAGTDAPALSERFNSPLAAMERHAEVTTLLRDAGWVVARHTASTLAA